MDTRTHYNNSNGSAKAESQRESKDRRHRHQNKNNGALRTCDSSTPSTFVPRILLLDMDGTLIGRINPQLCEYEVLTLLQKSRLKQFRADLVERMRQGIVRPHLSDFCRRVSPSYELFVYTASEDKWAKFLVPVIEEAIGFRFNRPILTRKHCILSENEYKKSIDLVSPLLFKSLKPKYAASLESKQDVMHNIVLVDNNHEVMLQTHPPLGPYNKSAANNTNVAAQLKDADRASITENAARLVRCPTYSYEYHIDVLSKVDPVVLNSRYSEVIPLLRDYGLFPHREGTWNVPSSSNNNNSSNVTSMSTTSFESFIAQYYSELASNARASVRENHQSLRDKMWALLADALCPLSALPQHRMERSEPAATSLRGRNDNKNNTSTNSNGRSQTRYKTEEVRPDDHRTVRGSSRKKIRLNNSSSATGPSMNEHAGYTAEGGKSASTTSSISLRLNPRTAHRLSFLVLKGDD